MNGFEPLRRRIIDYTEAGQWSEVYDGPLEDCESEKLKAENAKLRELVKSMYFDLTHMTFPPDWVTDYEADMRELGLEA